MKNKDNNGNFTVAVLLSIAILIGFHYLYEKPEMERAQQLALQKQAETATLAEQPAKVDIPDRNRDEILKEGIRVAIQTPELRGSINLKGARFDDLELVRYRETVDPSSPRIVLLSPAGSASPHPAYYAGFGWLAASGVATPGEDTVWTADAQMLTTAKPLRLTWDNGQGLVFERTIALDEHFLFTVSDRVRNKGGETVTLYPFGFVARHGKPQTQDTYVLHEGPIGVLDGTLKEEKYKTLMEERKIALDSVGGWIGITDKYWLVSLLPPQDEKITASFSFDPFAVPTEGHEGVFQTDFRGTPVSLAPGASAERKAHLFAGAKRVALLDQYAEQLSLPLFDRAIDFGWYYYLTKPFLYLLDEMDGLFGSMALAIVMLTILLKIVTLPLSLKSNRSMAKMKALQPEMKELQERYKDDKTQLNLQIMELYKREKVNPMSGCVPILIQIPIFFALYKVLYVGIEMRHTPLFGWVKDMSAPDPTSVLTLFGAVDWSFLPHVGVWPILMGISMFAQQKLSPQPTDKSQAQIFMFMPIIFTFMLASMSAGLIFYWTISNVLSIGQQWYIMHKTKGLHGK